MRGKRLLRKNVEIKESIQLGTTNKVAGKIVINSRYFKNHINKKVIVYVYEVTELSNKILKIQVNGR